jgi:single-strand DNA-binding protein
MIGDANIAISGNLCADPELRFTPSGVAVAKFSVAVSRRVKTPTGEYKDEAPSFYRCTLWRQPAENLAESLHKGDRVTVIGTLAERHWEKDGEKKSGWELTATAVGADLTYATAKVTRNGRREDLPPDDPWGSASRSRPDEAPTDGEPPF